MRDYYTEYELFEHKERSLHERRCIDGRITGCGNCVGYCKYCEHPGFLTQRQREQHDCINKQCRYYLPKTKKNRVKKNKDIRPEMLTSVAKYYSEEIDDLRVMRSYLKGDRWVINYITVFGDHNLSNIEKSIEQSTGLPVKMERLNYSFDRCVELILQ